MVNEVNTRRRPGDGGGAGPDPRLFLRDEELDRGVGLILAGERALMTASAAAMADHDLSSGEWQILLAVRYGPGRDVSKVRLQLGATVPTFARLLGRLDKKGLIEKTPSGEDGRRRVLHLSRAGEALILPVGDVLRETIKAAFRYAGAEAVAGSRAVLEALAEAAPSEKSVEGSARGSKRE